MRREDDEKLWDLLGRAGTPVVSPFFARNVVRAARQQPALLHSVRDWFSFGQLIPAATVAVALIAAVFVSRIPAGSGVANVNNSDPVAAIDPQDYEVVADLDELVASDENGLWDDNSSL